MSVGKLSQCFPSDPPPLTEQNLTDQSGKVFIVTGGGTGIGAELVKILYGANGIVYIAGRTEAKALFTIDACKEEYPNSRGRLEFLFLDLADLNTIKASANAFLAKESRLDVLWNNAGVAQTPKGYISAQNIELQHATNILGPFLFTKLLFERLSETSKLLDTPEASVRVCWASSLMMEQQAPKGVDMAHLQNGVTDESQSWLYSQSKAANLYLANEYERRYPDSGILSIAFNPGNIRSEITRHVSIVKAYMVWPFMFKPRMGAYTELYAGLSPDIGFEDKGGYVVPWGRISIPNKDILHGMTPQLQGGRGVTTELWDYCEQVVAKYT